MPTKIWEHCETPEEKKLAEYIQELAEKDIKTAIRAAAAAGQFAYPIAIKAGGQMAIEMRLSKDEDPFGGVDGLTDGLKLDAVETWLKDPSDKNLEAVKGSIDPTRQLEIWEPDIKPDEKNMWGWFMGVGQLCAMAVANEDGQKMDENSPRTWPPAECAVRSTVCAYKSIQQPDGNRKKELEQILEVIEKTIK